MKNDPLLKDVKTVFFIHDIDSNYNFSNNLFEKMNTYEYKLIKL